MKRKIQHSRPNIAVCIVAVFIMLAVLLFCFIMIHNINRQMNESAASNLLNTTQVIEGTIRTYIDKDIDSLNVVAQIYKNSDIIEKNQASELCEIMGFERIGIVDRQGNGAGYFTDMFNAKDLPWYDEWKEGDTGYSDAYMGEGGRLQMTLWVPVYIAGEYSGTVFGDVILNKYYSASVYTFYGGEGRTYLFDGSDGKWILRSLGTDGTLKNAKDIFSLLSNSGNSSEDLEAFQEAVESKHTGTAILKFNNETSYICFMPLSSSKDWYVSTVIAKDVLLKESNQVQRMIRVIITTFGITFVFFAASLAAWQIRKEKVKEVNYREALFANVSSNIDSVFVIYEKENKQTVFVSDNVKRLLGMERDWLESDFGRLFDWCNIDRNDRQRIDFLEGNLDGPVVREVCVENELGNKSRYIRLELIPADLDQEIAVLTDITKDKDIQQSLIETMEQSEAASRAKNDFLSSMSHDIRTPMNGIVGMTAIAAAHIDDKARVKNCLTKINEASAHLLNLINEVLDMSRIESGKIELAKEPFNLAELLQEVLNINYPGIQQKNHTIKVHIHSMEHEMVIGDPGRLQRITANLISNAIKYTPDGGTIILSLQEKSPVIKGYGCYELVVQDNGIGMSEEFQKRLYEPFEREEDVRVSKIQGTGLGMSIVKNVVELMMGNIQVESKKNSGTTFRVTVNLRLDEQTSEDAQKLEKLSVLVVDDDVVTCETVTNMLCDIGMAGEWVDNGFKAIERVTERHREKDDYLAIILDWKMPQMDGVETARRIRAEVNDDIPIIILTAYDWSEIEEEAREAGVNEFLAKPIYKSKLKQKMLSLANGGTEEPEVSTELIKQQILEGKRVLLVEDNLLNMEIAVELLKMAGVASDGAENGIEAVEKFAASEPGTYDLIMMDIQMPKMNGYDAARAIRNLNRDDSKTIPIIAMTADAFAQDIQASVSAGMNEHLSKPISLERLLHILEHYLSGQQNSPVKPEEEKM